MKFIIKPEKQVGEQVNLINGKSATIQRWVSKDYVYGNEYKVQFNDGNTGYINDREIMWNM